MVIPSAVTFLQKRIPPNKKHPRIKTMCTETLARYLSAVWKVACNEELDFYEFSFNAAIICLACGK